MAILVQFPHDHNNWPAIEAELKSLADSTLAHDAVTCMSKAYKAFWSKDGKPCKTDPYNGLRKFLQKESEAEIEKYSKKAFPMIGRLALEASKLIPEGGLEVIKAGNTKTVTLSRHFAACIVALGFLNLFDEIEADDLSMPSVSFRDFWFQISKSQIAKARMILNYFARLSDKIPDGNITYRRIVPDGELAVSILLKSTKDLCPFVTKNEGTIEDAGPNVLQIDFANQFLGGGVLWQGRVQEEIRFSICPELISSMLFMESMDTREAVIIQGFEQYSAYSGYGSTLGYAGDFTDPFAAPDKRGPNGDILTALSAIDAIPYFHGAQEQYERKYISRDVHKAYAGFLQPYAEKHQAFPPQDDPEWMFKLNPEFKRTIATGNWGCGAFKGDPQLKAMLQWMAASMADCPAIVYYTFADRRVQELNKMVSWINDQKWKIKDLMEAVWSYCQMVIENEYETEVTLFDFMKGIKKD